jgi:hypothetical protein
MNQLLPSDGAGREIPGALAAIETQTPVVFLPRRENGLAVSLDEYRWLRGL